MATITSILETKNSKLAPAAKLSAIHGIVKATRSVYGNNKCKIKSTSVNTCNGVQEMAYLSDKDKLALVKSEVANIRTAAIETTKATSGIIFEREIEKLVSTNPILCNIKKKSGESNII